MISSLPLFQLPGEVDSLALQQGVRVVSYHDRSLPVYKISVPSHLLFALPSDTTPSSSDMHMPLPSNDSSYVMEIPASVLDSLWPDLVQRFSQSTGMELVGEGMGNTSKVVIDLTMDEPCFDAEVIDLEDVSVEVAHAPSVNCRQSVHKTATHISVDLVIVLFRVDVTCHTSHVTMFVVYKQRSSLI